jgi:hypothetical protein
MPGKKNTSRKTRQAFFERVVFYPRIYDGFTVGRVGLIWCRFFVVVGGLVLQSVLVSRTSFPLVRAIFRAGGLQLRAALRPKLSAPPSLAYQQRPGQKCASGECFGEFVTGLLALPPVGPGLKIGSFVVRPLPILTPCPPRWRWFLRTLSQSPPPNHE